MRASLRPGSLARVALVASAPLLMADDCGPIPPEDDPVLATRPEVVARLEDQHPAAIALLRDYYERSVGDLSRFRLRDDSVAFDELDALRAAMPRLEAVVAVEYSEDGTPEDPYCGEGGEITRIELDLITRGLMGKPVPHVVSFELCRTSADGEDMVWADTGDLYVRDEAWVARVLRRAEGEALRLVNAYEVARQLERDALLGELLGCPVGTRYTRYSDAHYCVTGDMKHGPYIKGDLSDTLIGPRLVEGAYRHGEMQGVWKQYDADGILLSSTEWHSGDRVGWGGGF